jgi:HlyD family secretion protein
MKRTYWSLLASGILTAIIAASCGNPAPAIPAATQGSAVPAKTQAASAGTISASVVVEPTQTSHMAFLIAARVKQVNVKEGDQVKAGQALIVLDTPNLEFALAAAQAELKSAQANVLIQSTRRKTTLHDKIYYLSGPPEIRDKARARALQAQAALEVAQANLDEATLVAPFDGAVVSINAAPGEMVEPNKTVLVIGDLQHLQIATTDLSEREIASVHIGQTATTRLKAFEQDLTGKVVAIAPMATEHNGDTVYKVTINLDQQPNSLFWGMTGDVTIRAQ